MTCDENDVIRLRVTNHAKLFITVPAQICTDIYIVFIILLCLNSWLYKNNYSYSSRDLVVIFVIIGHATPSINFVYATTASKVHVICTPNVEHYITVSIKPIVNKRSWGSDMTKIKTSLVIFLWAKWRYCDVCTAVWPPSCIQLFSKVTERFAFFSIQICWDTTRDRIVIFSNNDEFSLKNNNEKSSRHTIRDEHLFINLGDSIFRVRIIRLLSVSFFYGLSTLGVVVAFIFEKSDGEYGVICLLEFKYG